MRKYVLFLSFFVPFTLLTQITENFSDGDFTNNPVWSGTAANFNVNSLFQLQSKSTVTSKSYLTTPSEAYENGVWETWVKINYNPSSSNYASVYIIADKADISGDFNGYYVQIGNTNDEISLYVQKGALKTKIIDGIDGRTNSNVVDIKIKVSRDVNGNFTLYSKLSTETEYTLEGNTVNNDVKGSKYFGLLFANTSTTGNAYFFDDIIVTGNKFIDIIPPSWNDIEIIGSNGLKLTFSEAMDISNAQFIVNNGIGSPVTSIISSDKTSIILTFSKDFEKGKIYSLSVENAIDLSGNKLINTQKNIGIVENPEIGDIVINEICFDAASNGEEYFEIYNTSDKIIDLNNLIFTTRKTDDSLNSGYAFPKTKLFLPRAYFAFSPNADSIKNVYHPLAEADIYSSSKWYSLNNSGGNLLVTNTLKDTIYDEIKYDTKWHHPLIRNSKGIALEKINPSFSGFIKSSWHSAASEANYGTPGYQNSQYREINSINSGEKWIWAEPESFSPDNDGVNDLCIFRYNTDENGYLANATIYNSVGMKIKSLISNSLLSTEGIITWDGTNEKGKIVNSNVYVLYIEIINISKGIKKTKKLPIVVSTK